MTPKERREARKARREAASADASAGGAGGGDALRALVKQFGDDATFIADDAAHAAEITGYMDTGSLALNGMISGSIFGGMPNNKVIAFAGEEATGKTYFVMQILRALLGGDPSAIAGVYDTESAITKDMLVARQIDPRRVMINETSTVQKFRTHLLKFLKLYGAMKDRPKMAVVLDSLGQLSTDKETADVESGSDKRDMTRSQLIKGAFRVLSLEMARLSVPLIVTNHVYDVIGAYVPTKKMGGGSGLKYAASIIIFLAKSKDKDENKDQVGVLIRCRNTKNRLTKEGSQVTVRLSFAGGLDRYYGLLDLGLKQGVIAKGKRGNSTVYMFPGLDEEDSPTEAQIDADPTKYYTEAVLKLLDEAAGREFKYGAGDIPGSEEPDPADEPETPEA